MTNSKKVIIFGANGQDGYYLNLFLLSKGYIVYKTSYIYIDNFIYVDIANYELVKDLIISLKPDLIFHFAAKSELDHKYILLNYSAIVSGTLNILEAVHKYSTKTKVCLASSGLIFKNNNSPLNIESELEINSAYTLNRILALKIARYYRTKKINVYTAFLFNHESPMRKESSLSRTIAKYAVDTFLGIGNNFIIRDSSIKRDFIHASDVVRAMYIFIMQNEIYEVCISNSSPISIYEYTFKLFNYLGLNLEDFHPNYINSNPTVFTGNSESIKKMGFIFEYDVNKLVKIMADNELSLRKL